MQQIDLQQIHRSVLTDEADTEAVTKAMKTLFLLAKEEIAQQPNFNRLIKDCEVVNRFAGMVDVDVGKAATISLAILAWIQKKGLIVKKLMGFGSDGVTGYDDVRTTMKNTVDTRCLYRANDPGPIAYNLAGRYPMGFPYRKPEDFNGAYGADSDAGIFRQPNLYHASEQDEALLVGDDAVKATCYKALVRPHLEYSAIVRDPYTTKGMQAVEAVQRRAARVTLNDYRRTSSVTQIA
ncbi:Hypp8302 [Branchiostoma lanceolatum]|uniref:Hypp8302 protein n=1 Tax=Branchiostoma lanceolatum TaxID=7740 RepID=A0A8J9Z6M0_BRALA|nr:Hypp8302 [Branchiostoma lanceolatum]